MQNLQSYKPGIKTTEFWATLMGTILVAGASELGLTIAPASAIGIASMIITYVIGRLINKKSHSQTVKDT